MLRGVSGVSWSLLALLLAFPLVGCGGATRADRTTDEDTSSDVHVLDAQTPDAQHEDSVLVSDTVDTYVSSDTVLDTVRKDSVVEDILDTSLDVTPSVKGLCEGPCTVHEDCGGANDLCLRNNNTGETFCSQFCGDGACPADFVCVSVNGFPQCVPVAETCGPVEPPPVCDPTCGAGEVCVGGSCVVGGQWEAELQFCVDLINDHRAQHGRSTLQRSSTLEDCAGAGAVGDSQSNIPHEHFSSTGGCGGAAYAENEIPGWNQGSYGSVANIIEAGTQSMMNEGPGGGHYENILGASHTSVGCGIHVTASGDVWVVQDFR